MALINDPRHGEATPLLLLLLWLIVREVVIAFLARTFLGHLWLLLHEQVVLIDRQGHLIVFGEDVSA